MSAGSPAPGPTLLIQNPNRTPALGSQHLPPALRKLATQKGKRELGGGHRQEAKQVNQEDFLEEAAAPDVRSDRQGGPGGVRAWKRIRQRGQACAALVGFWCFG